MHGPDPPPSPPHHGVVFLCCCTNTSLSPLPFLRWCTLFVNNAATPCTRAFERLSDPPSIRLAPLRVRPARARGACCLLFTSQSEDASVFCKHCIRWPGLPFGPVSSLFRPTLSERSISLPASFVTRAKFCANRIATHPREATRCWSLTTLPPSVWYSHDFDLKSSSV